MWSKFHRGSVLKGRDRTPPSFESKDLHTRKTNSRRKKKKEERKDLIKTHCFCDLKFIVSVLRESRGTIADRHSKTNAIHWIAIGSVARVQRWTIEIGACRALVSAARPNHTENIHGRYFVSLSLSRSPSCFLFRSANERSPSSNLAIVGTLNARNQASYAAETYVSARLRANCRPSIAVFVRHGTSPRESLPFLLRRLLECLVSRRSALSSVSPRNLAKNRKGAGHAASGGSPVSVTSDVSCLEFSEIVDLLCGVFKGLV